LPRFYLMTEILSLVVVVVHQLLDDGKKYCFILFNNGLKFLLVSVNKTKTKPKRSLHDILVEFKKKNKTRNPCNNFFLPKCYWRIQRTVVSQSTPVSTTTLTLIRYFISIQLTHQDCDNNFLPLKIIFRAFTITASVRYLIWFKRVFC
jgi:hypothetical protein